MEFQTYMWRSWQSPEVDWDAELDIEALDVYDVEVVIAESPFNPDNPAVRYGRLTNDWGNHPAGALVVSDTEEDDKTLFAVSEEAAPWL